VHHAQQLAGQVPHWQPGRGVVLFCLRLRRRLWIHPILRVNNYHVNFDHDITGFAEQPVWVLLYAALCLMYADKI
jgi:hypothetical protein